MYWGENCETVICVHHASSPPPLFFGIICKFVDFVDSMTLEASLTCSNKQANKEGFFFQGNKSNVIASEKRNRGKSSFGDDDEECRDECRETCGECVVSAK